MLRGRLQFEITDRGDLLDTASNVELLRRLWLDRTTIDGSDLGEGDPGDFDHGAWHIACHLVAACGVLRAADEGLLWLEISHLGSSDLYFPSVTADAKKPTTYSLSSAEGRALVRGATVLGFVEGNSSGRISIRGACDSPTLFNLWRRQDFDQPEYSAEAGGKVWEHWCTTRDIRHPSAIGTSVLSAYVSLMSVLGDRFAARVGRGRTEYAHPKQLAALVQAGLTGEDAVTEEAFPIPIPISVEKEFLSADPARSLTAAATLDWSNAPTYYMFERRISKWCSSELVRDSL